MKCLKTGYYKQEHFLGGQRVGRCFRWIEGWNMFQMDRGLEHVSYGQRVGTFFRRIEGWNIFLIFQKIRSFIEPRNRIQSVSARYSNNICSILPYPPSPSPSLRNNRFAYPTSSNLPIVSVNLAQWCNIQGYPQRFRLI